jgi:hypothetical protein
VLSKRDQHDSAPERRPVPEKNSRSRKQRAPAPAGVAARPDDHPDALRLAVETLSAEICWFLAGHHTATGRATDSPPRPQTP